MAALEAMAFSFVVLADERAVQLLLASLGLVAALLVAAIVVAWVNRWRRHSDLPEDLSPNAQLAHFRSLYETGTISAEEFERLRAVLNARMRQSLGMPSSPPPAEPEVEKRPTDGPDTGIRPA